MKYLALIKHSESFRGMPIPKALNDAMGEFVGTAMQSGVVTETAGLKPTAESFRIQTSGGKLHLTDGPFAESKEIVGGFAILNVASDKEAREFCRQFMELHSTHWPEFEGECEVRPFEDM